MKHLFLFLLFSGLCISAYSQRAGSTPAAGKKTTTVQPRSTPKPTPKPTPKADPAAERSTLDAAIALSEPDEKAAALEQFIEKHPDSRHLKEAKFHLAVALSALGESMLNLGDTDAAAEYFIRSLYTADTPIDTRLFEGIYAKLPGALFFAGGRDAAFDLAKLIEQRISGNAARLVTVAAFYLSIEDGTEAKRLAEAAIEADQTMSAAYMSLGMANRLIFDLDASAAAFAKALELDPGSINAKRSLAEIKRALDKPAEAEKLYEEILAVSPEDAQSLNGSILSMFENGKRAEAKAAFEKAIEHNPNNFSLIAGTAYWYVSVGDGERAVELASKAISAEPRYVWSHIAMARGLMLQNKPVEAERALIAARQYGNFPTLEYEIAIARMKAGFFREAVEELEKSFSIDGDGVSTNLGGRIERTDKTLDELVAAERRSSILAAKGAADPRDPALLLALFRFTELLNTDAVDEGAIVNAVDAFVAGDDAMRIHRQLFAAGLLLEKRTAVEKAQELVTTATGQADSGLSVANPSAAVMASELYETRKNASIKNEFLLVPDVPRQTLSAILRGRIEELSGFSLLLQGNYDAAAVRLRRAISVLPKNSAWWRTSKWRLGDALAAGGKEQEALDNYIQSYDPAKPDIVKYITIEGLYKKINGSTDGLEQMIGVNPLPPVDQKIAAAASPSPVPATADAPPETAVITDDKVGEQSEKKVEEEQKTQPENGNADNDEEKKEKEPVAEPEETKLPETPKTDPPKNAERSGDEPVKPGDPEKSDEEQESKEAPKTDNTEQIKQAVSKDNDRPVTAEEAKADEETPSAEVVKGSVRPRIVTIRQADAKSDECSVDVGQDNISLINNGGSIGILVGIKGDVEDRSIKAESKNPQNVEIVLEREMTGAAGRSFYIIRSISSTLGQYKIEFSNAACGKKEITVTVR